MKEFRDKGQRLFIFLVLFAALLLPACRGTVAPGPVHKYKVTFGFAKTLNYLPIIALEQGYFSSEGLDVTVVEYATGKRVLQDGVLGAQVDLGIVGIGPFVMASFDHKELRILGSTSTHFDLYRIVARKDAGILKAADLRGKRVATSKGSSFHFFLHNFLIENGLADQDIKLVFRASAELPGALADGEIDAFSSREPFIGEAEKLLGDDIVVLADPALPANTLNLVALDGFVQDQPEVVERMIGALIRAEDFAARYPDQAMRIVSAYLGVEASQLTEAWSKTVLKISLDQELVLELENIARWAIRDGITDSEEIPNYLDYIDVRGMAAVAPDRITVFR